MRILLLTDGITPFVTGGMQRHSANIAKFFTLSGVDVTLAHCVPYGEAIPNPQEVNKKLFNDNYNKLKAIRGFNFPKPSKVPGHYIRNSYKYSKTLFNAFDFSEFDFVYAKGFCGWFYMEQKKRGVALPLIGVKFHGYEMYQANTSVSQKLKAKLLRKPTKWNNEHADFIFSYGGKITNLIKDNFKLEKTQVLEYPSGIDNQWIRKSEVQEPSHIKKFVFIGRDEVRKGVHELQIVLQKLIVNHDFEMHFIGPLPEGIIHKNIFYHGELKSKNRITDLLDKMDVLVCPSHSEGMPNVILEGMARGLAILATDVGAVEFIVNNENGLIIPPLELKSLENALSILIDMQSEDLLKMKLNSLQKVKKQYLWEKLAQEIKETIENLYHKPS